MGEIVELHKKANLADTLRKLADMVDDGKYPGKSATIIIDTEIHGFSTDKTGIFGIIWDCNFAIHAIMNAQLYGMEDE
jgi:hypothetical protein